mgnify:FL=1
MNVLEQIEAYMDCGMTSEQAAELVDRERNPQDYFDDGFDDERERLIKSIEEKLR